MSFVDNSEAFLHVIDFSIVMRLFLFLQKWINSSWIQVSSQEKNSPQAAPDFFRHFKFLNLESARKVYKTESVFRITTLMCKWQKVCLTRFDWAILKGRIIFPSVIFDVQHEL